MKRESKGALLFCSVFVFLMSKIILHNSSVIYLNGGMKFAAASKTDGTDSQ